MTQQSEADKKAEEALKKKKEILPEGMDKDMLKRLITFIIARTEENAATYEELYREFNLDKRQVRTHIEIAKRIFKARIRNGKNGKGYCRADSWKDYNPAYRKQMRHAISIIKTQNAIKKDFLAKGTFTLFDAEIFNTEFESIIQAVEAYKEPERQTNGKLSAEVHTA